MVQNKTQRASPVTELRQRIPKVQEIFDVGSVVGRGTFSTVLLATLKSERVLPAHERRRFALKHHKPTSHPKRIVKELQCTAKIGGSNNVVGVIFCLRHAESVAFVMPYMPYDRFASFYKQMNAEEIRQYIKNLLLALRHVHSFNVIHRDVKPSNFLYNRSRRQYLLIDFGLANQLPKVEQRQQDVCTTSTSATAADKSKARGMIRPRSRSRPPQVADAATGMTAAKRRKQACHCYMTTRVCSICLVKAEMIASRAGTPGYRPPEVLLKSTNQTTAVDIWAVGVILLSILSTVYPFFKAPNDYIALCEIVTLFGHKPIKLAAERLGRAVTTSSNARPKNLRRLCLFYRNRHAPMQQANTEMNACACVPATACACQRNTEHMQAAPCEIFPETLYEILYMMLNVDPAQRISAAELLQHPIFAVGFPSTNVSMN